MSAHAWQSIEDFKAIVTQFDRPFCDLVADATAQCLLDLRPKSLPAGLDSQWAQLLVESFGPSASDGLAPGDANAIRAWPPEKASRWIDGVYALKSELENPTAAIWRQAERNQ